MSRETSRTKLLLPVALAVTVIGAVGAIIAACGDDHPTPADACVTTNDGGARVPCDAGPPDAPIV